MDTGRGDLARPWEGMQKEWTVIYIHFGQNVAALNPRGPLVRVLPPGQVTSWRGPGQGKASHWYVGWQDRK